MNIIIAIFISLFYCFHVSSTEPTYEELKRELEPIYTIVEPFYPNLNPGFVHIDRNQYAGNESIGDWVILESSLLIHKYTLSAIKRYKDENYGEVYVNIWEVELLERKCSWYKFLEEFESRHGKPPTMFTSTTKNTKYEPSNFSMGNIPVYTFGFTPNEIELNEICISGKAVKFIIFNESNMYTVTKRYFSKNGNRSHLLNFSMPGLFFR
jgi:hypothetical protein